MAISLHYFNSKEFECKCGKCGKEFADMDETLLLKLDEARKLAGVAFNITSAFRCPAHNKKVGGVADSAHLTGKAVDISTPDNITRFKVVKALMDVGFIRIGINLDSNFIHCDVDMSKLHPTMFKY